MSEIVHIPFHGDELMATLVNGKPHVVLKPAIEAVGLDYKSQLDKLRGKSWATVGMSPMVAADGRLREMVTVDVRTLLMLLATIDEHRVAEHVRPKLIAYQAEVADVIESHFTGPRPVSQLDMIIAAAQEMKRVEALALESRLAVTAVEQRVDALEGNHGWYSALGYAKKMRWATDTQSLNALGRRAGQVGRDANLKAAKVPHSLFGEVNAWPEWCWDQAYQDLDPEAGVA